MTLLPRAFLLAVCGLPLAWFVSAPASATIQCIGPNQVIKGQGLLPSLYCQDQYLAEVAASRGRQVSAANIRRNLNFKADVCNQFGHDIRVQGICQGYRPEDRSSIRTR